MIGRMTPRLWFLWSSVVFVAVLVGVALVEPIVWLVVFPATFLVAILIDSGGSDGPH